MFDLDAGKLIVIGVIALVVIGPKELPRVLRQVGQATGKLRRMAAEFQGQFMDAMREADVENLKKEMASVTDAAKVDINFDPVRDVSASMTEAIDGPKQEGAPASADAAGEDGAPAPKSEAAASPAPADLGLPLVEAAAEPVAADLAGVPAQPEAAHEPAPRKRKTRALSQA